MLKKEETLREFIAGTVGATVGAIFTVLVNAVLTDYLDSVEEDETPAEAPEENNDPKPETTVQEDE